MSSPPKHRILLVEDDHALRETLMELLIEQGFEVRAATNGQHALDQITSGFRPDLILLDLMMPVMDGLAFRHHQRQHPEWADIPVIGITAHADRIQDLDFECLLKPFHAELLLTRARSIVGRPPAPEARKRPSVGRLRVYAMILAALAALVGALAKLYAVIHPTKGPP